ncbi:MAG: hypothetical protein NUK65_06130, partial [Firmicutes bacterium]|nr:hypothetical protein [Bacillota bacterium]
EIDYVTVKRYLINPQPVLYYKSHYFRSYNSDFDANTAAVRITKQAEQNELISRSRTNYFAAAGGYIIGVYIKDHGPTFMFLPQKDAPDFITNL